MTMQIRDTIPAPPPISGPDPEAMRAQVEGIILDAQRQTTRARELFRTWKTLCDTWAAGDIAAARDLWTKCCDLEYHLVGECVVTGAIEDLFLPEDV